MKHTGIIVVLLIATLLLLLGNQLWFQYNSIEEQVNYKEEQVMAGQVWLFTSDDPFHKPVKQYVFDVKDEYVLYRFRPDTNAFATSTYIKFFLQGSVLIDTFPLPCNEKTK